MKGNKLCLCFLLAAGVGLGAHAQDKIAAPMKDVNQVVDNTLDSLNVVRSARPVSGPSPSIFMALRLMKCSIFPLICGGQAVSLGQ